MYLYAFSLYAGADKVFYYEGEKMSFQAGDLLQEGSDFFLVLGEKISFPESVTTRYTSSPKLFFPQLLKAPSIQLLHWMVYERYTSYKKVVPLFLDHDITALLSKAQKEKQNKQSFELTIGKTKISHYGEGQVLIVFPDLWTVSNIIDLQHPQGLLLSALDGKSKKNKHRWQIKSWAEKLIFSTGSEVFQDFMKLEKIYFIEPQKWYYSSQQDPRYKVETVLRQMTLFFQAELHILESETL